VHIAAFGLSLNVPSAQGTQLRSVVALPSVATASPGSQSVHSLHSIWSLF
jgi:hypothetical protein